MDWASLIGLVLALGGVLLGQLLEGGHLGSLIQPAAFVVVVVGTVGAVLLQSNMQSFLRGLDMVRWIFSPPSDNSQEIAHDIGLWSQTARRDGFVRLESHMDAANDPFTVKGLRMIIDGVSAEKLREILDVEITMVETRERQAVKLWEAAGGVDLGPRDALARASIGGADYGYLRKLRRLLPTAAEPRGGATVTSPSAALDDQDGGASAGIGLGIGSE